MKKTYSLTDLEAALRACHFAVIQTRRGHDGPIFTLNELKKAKDALAALVAKARAESDHTLTLRDIGDLLPRLTYWHHQDGGAQPSRRKLTTNRAEAR